MDLLHTYPNFKDDISECFKILIDDFDLELLELSEGQYLLKGSKCNLRFTFDRGDISCQFKNITENLSTPGYAVSSVYRFLFPNIEPQNNEEPDYNFKYQLSGYSNMIQNKLINILQGDFTWVNDFVVKEKKEIQLTQFVLSNFDYGSPILKKFFAGDSTWHTDLEKYLKDNNIS